MKGFSVHLERGLLLGAVALLACSGGWAGWRMATDDRNLSNARKRLPGAAVVANPWANESPATDEVRPEGRIWQAPPTQTHGPEWIYELFTPPTIYRREESGEFLASLPAAKNPAAERSNPGFDLLEVRPALFRLQLVGFAGEEGHFLGLFENTLTTEHFLAGKDQAIPALGLKIERLRVIHDQGREAGETIATAGLVAEALVRDEVTGEIIVLTDSERTYHGEPAAIIGLHGAHSEKFTLRKNEEIEREGIRYRLRDVRAAPPSVDLIAESPAGAESDSEAWTLTVASEGGS